MRIDGHHERRGDCDAPIAWYTDRVVGVRNAIDDGASDSSNGDIISLAGARLVVKVGDDPGW